MIVDHHSQVGTFAPSGRRDPQGLLVLPEVLPLGWKPVDAPETAYLRSS
jgi:hypothetical protein